MVNQYVEISISINDIAMKKKTNFRIHIVFLSAYMPNMQCLYTFTVTHTSHTHTHRICIDIDICAHTYIYANNAFMQICINKYAYTNINSHA